MLKSFPRPSAEDVVEIPSTRNRFAFVRCPFTFTGLGDPVSPGAPGFTPALSTISCCQLLPFSGISETSDVARDDLGNLRALPWKAVASRPPPHERIP